MIISTVGISKLIKVILSAFVSLFHPLFLNWSQKDRNYPADDLIQHKVLQVCKEFYQLYQSYFCKDYSAARSMPIVLRHSENQDFSLKNVCSCAEQNYQTIFDCSASESDDNNTLIAFSSIHTSLNKSGMYLANNQLQIETSFVQPKIYSTTSIPTQNLAFEDYENSTFQFQDSNVGEQIQKLDATEICKSTEQQVITDEVEERLPLKQLFPVNSNIYVHPSLQEFQLFKNNNLVCNNSLSEIWKDDQENIEVSQFFIQTQKSNPSFHLLKAEPLKLQSCFIKKGEDENENKTARNSLFSELKNLQIYCFEVSSQSLFIPLNGDQNGFGFQNDGDIDMQVQQIDSFPIYDPSLMVDEIIDEDPQPFVTPILKQIRKIYVFGHLMKFFWKQIKDQISFSI